MINTKDYAYVLKTVLELQIGYKEEEICRCRSYAEERYIDGIITGLRIALEKINESTFLME